MRNVFPFLNGLANHHAHIEKTARALVSAGFARRSECDSASIAYHRDCLRDAIAAIRCCEAMRLAATL